MQNVVKDFADLKPENIFVVKDLGEHELVKIVDFGIATQTVGVASSTAQGPVPQSAAVAGVQGTIGQALTQAGTMIGTPAYMAPEQINGTGQDPRADQYALGCILHEMCTKELPFDGPNLMQLLDQHLHAEVTPMRQRYPHLAIPQELDELVGRLLAKEPAGRFAAIQEVESALALLIDHYAPDGRYAPGGSKSAKKGWRWPLWVGAAVASGALLGGGTYVALRAGSRAALSRESPLASGELAALRAAALEVTQWFLVGSSQPLRLAAIVAIGQTHDEATLPLLVPLLADPQPAVQAQAAEVLGQIGEPTAAGALGQLLATARPAAVEAAVGVALDRLGDPRGRQTLDRLLSRPEPEAQFRAALALCQRGDSGATARLQSLLGTMNAPAGLEQRALGCLALHGDDAARQRLRDKLRGPLHPKLKLSPAGELAQLGDIEAGKFLHDLASTPGPEQLLAGQWLGGPEEALLRRSREVLADPGAELNARALAAENLGSGGDLGDVRRLVPHLRADSAELSLASAGALLQLAANDPSLLSTQSARFASLAATAGDWSLRQSAAAVFGDSVKGGDALAQLLRLQSDGDARVRRGVARALGRRPEYGALAALRQLLHDADAMVRSEALIALLHQVRTQLRQGQAQLLQSIVPWLQELVGSSTPAEEVQVRAALLQLGQTAQRQPLLDLLGRAPPAIRLLIVQSAGADAELLTRGLADGDFAVRLLAARALALGNDRRAVPALREALGRGGPAALLAFGLLRRLGEKEPLPADLERTLRDPDPGVRSQAVETAVTLPLEQALAVLRRAAGDPAVAVRQTALEAAAELKDGASDQLPGSFILRLLIADSDAAVRARAAALLARAMLASEAGSRLLLPPAASPAAKSAPAAGPGERAVTPTPDLAPAPDRAVPAPPDAGAAAVGSLLLEGTVGTPVQLDKGPWSTLGKQARELPTGPHVVAYLDGEQTVLVTLEKAARLPIPPAPVEKLVSVGQELLKKSELGKAQKQLERAGQLCIRDRRYAVLCAGLKPAIAFALGRAYEGQDRLAEAMGEYEKAVAGPDAKALSADRAAAQAAVGRLASQLGQVLVPRQGKAGCVEDRIWMPPGTHTVKVEGQSFQVKVRAREVVQVGECK